MSSRPLNSSNNSSHNPVSFHLVLVGLSGAGKSTVGRMLAKRLLLPFVDLDRRLEAESGMSVSDIFSTYGEPEFRLRESRLLEAVLTESPSVIAAGGGTLVDDHARQSAKARGRIIWLVVSPQVAAERVMRSEARPLLTKNAEKSLLQLLTQREASYSDCDVSLNSDVLSPAELTDELVRWVEQENCR
jgi:shikimate kinase